MPKVKPAETSEDSSLLTVTPPPKKRGGKPVAIEEHTVVKKWAEEVKVEKPSSKPAPKKAAVIEDDDEDDLEIDERYEEYPPQLASFLQMNVGSPDVTMEVRRIDGPKMDVMPGIRAGTYMSNHRFDPDTYLDDLALYYAEPGKDTRFMLRLKCAGQYVADGTIFPVDVIGASLERKAAAGVVVQQPAPPAAITVTQAVPNPAPVEPPDPMAGIRQTLSLLKEFQGIGLIPKLERNHQEPVVVQPQNTDPKLELARYVMETPELAKQAIGNLIGGEAATAKAGVTEMIVSGAIDLAQSLMPTVGPALANFFNARAQAEQMRAHQLQQQLNGLPAAPSLPEQAAPQQMPEPQVPLGPSPIQSPVEIPPEDELFGRILGACARRQLLKPEVAARNLLDYTDQFTHPETGYNKFNEAYDIFITNDVKTIITLAAAQNPIAARMAGEPDTEGWLTALQDELRKEWDNAEDGSSQQP